MPWENGRYVRRMLLDSERRVPRDDYTGQTIHDLQGNIWQQDERQGVGIWPARLDALEQDMADAIGECLHRDGAEPIGSREGEAARVVLETEAGVRLELVPSASPRSQVILLPAHGGVLRKEGDPPLATADFLDGAVTREALASSRIASGDIGDALTGQKFAGGITADRFAPGAFPSGAQMQDIRYPGHEEEGRGIDARWFNDGKLAAAQLPVLSRAAGKLRLIEGRHAVLAAAVGHGELKQSELDAWLKYRQETEETKKILGGLSGVGYRAFKLTAGSFNQGLIAVVTTGEVKGVVDKDGNPIRVRFYGRSGAQVERASQIFSFSEQRSTGKLRYFGNSGIDALGNQAGAEEVMQLPAINDQTTPYGLSAHNGKLYALYTGRSGKLGDAQVYEIDPVKRSHALLASFASNITTRRIAEWDLSGDDIKSGDTSLMFFDKDQIRDSDASPPDKHRFYLFGHCKRKEYDTSNRQLPDLPGLLNGANLSDFLGATNYRSGFGAQAFPMDGYEDNRVTVNEIMRASFYGAQNAAAAENIRYVPKYVNKVFGVQNLGAIAEPNAIIVALCCDIQSWPDRDDVERSTFQYDGQDLVVRESGLYMRCTVLAWMNTSGVLTPFPNTLSADRPMVGPWAGEYPDGFLYPVLANPNPTPPARYNIGLQMVFAPNYNNQIYDMTNTDLKGADWGDWWKGYPHRGGFVADAFFRTGEGTNSRIWLVGRREMVDYAAADRWTADFHQVESDAFQERAYPIAKEVYELTGVGKDAAASAEAKLVLRYREIAGNTTYVDIPETPGADGVTKNLWTLFPYPVRPTPTLNNEGRIAQATEAKLGQAGQVRTRGTDGTRSAGAGGADNTRGNLQSFWSDCSQLAWLDGHLYFCAAGKLYRLMPKTGPLPGEGRYFHLAVRSQSLKTRHTP